MIEGSAVGLQRLVSSEGQDVFEEVLELVSYFTYFSPQARSLIADEASCNLHVAREGACISFPPCLPCML